MSEAVTVPVHVGFILDGNRRWAKERGLHTFEGHKRGMDVFKDVASHAFRRGADHVTGFVFSTENWQRTEEEVGYLMNLVTSAIDNYLEEFHKEGIRIVILGRREGLRNKVLKAISRAEETTKDNTKGTLALCFNYGGQDEIIDAVKQIVDSNTSSADITKELLSRSLYTPDVPPVDLIIRTSGEQRLSGFMLWRAAYAELYFTDVFWPSFSENDLDKAFDHYATRERRFGN